MSRDRAFGVKELKAKCEHLHDHMYNNPDQAFGTKAELDAVWPGGEDNKYRGYDAWIYCYAQLAAFVRRKDDRERAQQRDGHSNVDDALEGAVRAAGAEQPITLTLSDGTTQQVFPKGAFALQWCDALGEFMATLAALGAQANEFDDELQINAQSAPIYRAESVRLWLWIITTPGADVPWLDTDIEVTAPAWTRTITPQDLFLFDRTFRQLHQVRVAIMAAAFPPEPGEASRLSIGGMLGQYHAEHSGTTLRDVHRKISLPAVVAASIAQAESYRVARARADATANAERSRRGRA